MTPVTRGEKVFFGAVGLLALWVGVWGCFLPGHVDLAIPWLVPPLHARFVGAIYFSGLTLMIGGMLARYYTEVRVLVPLITIWTGMLFVLSLFHLDEFDFGHKPVWFWFGAYIIYPLIGIWLIWRHRTLSERTSGPALPSWGRGYLLAQGVLVTILALSLLLAPDLMVNAWPWKITRLLAQIYSAPFLALGVSSLLLSREQAWPEVRVVVIGSFVLTLGVLLASIIHRALLPFANPASWAWFGGFLLAAVMLGSLIARSVRASSPT